MSPDQVSRLFAADGLWVLGDDRLPGTTGVVLTMSAYVPSPHSSFLVEETRAWSMIHGEELTHDPAFWQDRPTWIAGGPYSVKNVPQETRAKERLDTLDTAVREAKGILREMRDAGLEQGVPALAALCQKVMDVLSVEETA